MAMRQIICPKEEGIYERDKQLKENNVVENVIENVVVKLTPAAKGGITDRIMQKYLNELQ